MFHPWRLLRSRAHLDLQEQDLGDDGPIGTYDGSTITLTTGLLQVERRCALLHELIHDERGMPHGDDPREESLVEQEVARRLITLGALEDGLRWSRTPSEVADLLWVTEAVLQVRLEHLHPAERHHLRRRLDEHHDD